MDPDMFDNTEDLFRQVEAERDALRAEVERLRGENEQLKTGDISEAYNAGERKIIDMLGAANERIERLRGELAAAKEANLAWVRENATGGWIDTLRKELVSIPLCLRFGGWKDYMQRTEAAETHAGNLYRYLRHTLQALGGVAEHGVSDELLSMVPEEAAAMKARAEAAEAELQPLKQWWSENPSLLHHKLATVTARADTATAHAADLRAALEAQRSLPIARSQTPAGQQREDEVEALVERVLASTPAQSLAAVKARVLEAAATVFLAEWPEAAEKLRAEAAELEKEAGR